MSGVAGAGAGAHVVPSWYLRGMRAHATAEVLRPEPMTLEQWAELDEDEPGELVDGWLVEEEVPTNLHEIVVSWLMYVLWGWADPRGGLVLGSEHKLGLSPMRGRKPDVTMYAPGTQLDVQASLSRTAPYVTIEVISTQARDVRRDRREKLHEYAQFGIKWYWLLDPEARLLEIFELGADGRYTLARSAADEPVEVPGCEGLVLDLAALWSRVDRVHRDDDEAATDSGEG